MRTAVKSDMSLPVSMAQPMPPLALAERFNEIGLNSNLVRVIVFGGDYHANLISQAFMRHEHVMVVKGATCIIAPSYEPWQQTLNRLENAHA